MNTDPASTLNRHFQRIESCLDYQAYVYRIDPGIPSRRYAAICSSLAQLGKTKEERMGAVYVYAPWGFCVVPRHGFPELRLNFHHDIPIKEIWGVMASIDSAFTAL